MHPKPSPWRRGSALQVTVVNQAGLLALSLGDAPRTLHPPSQGGRNRLKKSVCSTWKRVPPGPSRAARERGSHLDRHTALSLPSSVWGDGGNLRILDIFRSINPRGQFVPQNFSLLKAGRASPERTNWIRVGLRGVSGFTLWPCRPAAGLSESLQQVKHET